MSPFATKPFFSASRSALAAAQCRRWMGRGGVAAFACCRTGAALSPARSFSPCSRTAAAFQASAWADGGCQMSAIVEGCPRHYYYKYFVNRSGAAVTFGTLTILTHTQEPKESTDTCVYTGKLLAIKCLRQASSVGSKRAAATTRPRPRDASPPSPVADCSDTPAGMPVCLPPCAGFVTVEFRKHGGGGSAAEKEHKTRTFIGSTGPRARIDNVIKFCHLGVAGCWRRAPADAIVAYAGRRRRLR